MREDFWEGGYWPVFIWKGYWLTFKNLVKFLIFSFSPLRFNFQLIGQQLNFLKGLFQGLD